MITLALERWDVVGLFALSLSRARALSLFLVVLVVCSVATTHRSLYINTRQSDAGCELPSKIIHKEQGKLTLAALPEGGQFLQRGSIN